MTDTQRPWDRLTTKATPRTKRSPRTSTPARCGTRTGNEKAPPSHRRDSQSASRHAAIREQRQRLREHLIQPGVLERHQVRALHLRLAPKFLQLRCHVVPGRAFRDVRQLLHGPLDADPVRVGIRVDPVLGELRRDRAVAGAGQPILHRRPTPHREPLHFPLGPGRGRLRPMLPLARRGPGEWRPAFTFHGVSGHLVIRLAFRPVKSSHRVTVTST